MLPIQFDGLITISTATSRRSTKWKNTDILWSEFASKLSQTTRTPETANEYARMPKSERDNIKDVGGFVGGALKNGHRKADTIAFRRLITLDIDSVPYDVDPWKTVSLLFDCTAVLYSTHSHTALTPRFRLIMPLSRPVSSEEYEAIARKIADDIGIDFCDDTTYEPHRLMYWPSSSCDAEFRYEFQDGPWLNADDWLASYIDWKDPTQWPVSSRKNNISHQLAAKQGDPTSKEGIIGAFCRAFPIEDAIETFLPDKYMKAADNRYTYIPGSTFGGLIVYDEGKFAYSHHSTDPICGKLCNSFDLVRCHLYGIEDENANPETPTNRLPSFKLMTEKAITIESVLQELKAEQLSSVIQIFSNEEQCDWLYQIEINPKTNKPAATIQNIFLILTHDPRIKDSYYYDEFRERPVVCGNFPWESLSNRISTSWIDTDDAGLRNLLEHEYKIDNAPKIRDAVDLAINSKKIHPVREYLKSLTWDGTKRAETVFIDYLGAEDCLYTREVTRKALIGAVARILSPGCKHDHMLVLVGPQGCKKSTTLAKLGREWFSDSLYTMNGKDAYEQLQGNWIIELAEMAATKKSEVEQIKQFISKQEDTYRAAYARRTQSHLRQCAFFGTTNDDEFLRDYTGARRFWPVSVTHVGKTQGDKLTSEIVDQIWAEAVICYESGEKWYLSEDVEMLAHKVQAHHTEHNVKTGLIENFLNTLLPKDWDNWSLDKRLLFWDNGFGEKASGTELRTKVCVMEIWQELFRGDPKMCTQAQAREISNILKQNADWKISSCVNCGPLYGRQRGFIKKER